MVALGGHVSLFLLVAEGLTVCQVVCPGSSAPQDLCWGQEDYVGSFFKNYIFYVH